MWVIGIIVAVLVIYYISAYNSFRKMKVTINESLSGIDVALEKRYDTLTKMYDLVKKYMKYESSTLTDIVKLRQGGIQDKEKANALMDDLKGNLDVVFEQYPDLKASTNVLELQTAVQEVEDHLSASRRLYNNNVSSYNQMVVVFPKSIVASIMHLQKEEFFKVSEGKAKDVVFD